MRYTMNVSTMYDANVHNIEGNYGCENNAPGSIKIPLAKGKCERETNRARADILYFF